jgi:hypothetical protein
MLGAVWVVWRSPPRSSWARPAMSLELTVHLPRSLKPAREQRPSQLRTCALSKAIRRRCRSIDSLTLWSDVMCSRTNKTLRPRCARWPLA